MTTKSKPVFLKTTQTYESRSTGGIDAFGQIVSPVKTLSSPFQNFQFNESFTGDDRSGFRKIIKQGGNVQNAASGQRLTSSVTPFYAECYAWVNPFWHAEGRWRHTIWGELAGSMPTLPSISSTATNRAKSSFIKKANAAVTSIQGGTFLGELRETIQTIRHPLAGTRGLMSSHLDLLKKGRRGFKRADIKSKVAYLRDQWLESSYAIKPLMSDVKSGAEALAKIATRHQTLDSIRGFGADKQSVSEIAGNILQQSILKVGYTTRVVDVSESHYYGAVMVEGSNTQFNLDALGLNIDQFAPTIWELIPYSFLVDYFANVGQIVEAASFNTSRLKFWGSSDTGSRYFISTVIGDLTPTTDPSYISSSVSSGETAFLARRFLRSTLPSLVPSLEFKLPTYAAQWANIVALGLQHKGLLPY